MATFSDTDLLLVQSNNSTEKITFAQLKAKTVLNDTDLFLINNGTVTNKVAWSEIKDEIGSNSINPNDNDFTITPAPQSGTGTSADPFILQDVSVSPAGQTAQTVETIAVADQDADKSVVWEVTTTAGNRFAQAAAKTDANGDWSGKLSYADTPNTATDSTYEATFKLGQVHFKWKVIQYVVQSVAPEIGNITLTEQAPGTDPRFTSSKFDVAVTMTTQGTPTSIKKFQAYVEGTINGVDNTRKYLVFNSAGTITDMQDQRMDPPVSKTEDSPSFTLTFPAQFPSGNAPDDELAEGTSLYVECIASSQDLSTDPATATVQPEGVSPPSSGFDVIIIAQGGRQSNGQYFRYGGAGGGSIGSYETLNGANNGWVSSLGNPRGPWRLSVGFAGSSTTTKMEYTNNSGDYVLFKDEGISGGDSGGYSNSASQLGGANGGGVANSYTLDAGNNPVGGTGSQSGFGSLYKRPGQNGGGGYTDNSSYSYGGGGGGWNGRGTNGGVGGNGTGGDGVRNNRDGCWLGQGNDDSGIYNEFCKGRNGNELPTRPNEYGGGGCPGLIAWRWRKSDNAPDPTVVIEGTSTTPNTNYVSFHDSNDGVYRILVAKGGSGDTFEVSWGATRMSAEVYAEQQLRFATYENRRDVHQGELAMAKRNQLMKELQAAGASPPAINKLLGGTSS